MWLYDRCYNFLDVCWLSFGGFEVGGGGVGGIKVKFMIRVKCL